MYLKEVIMQREILKNMPFFLTEEQAEQVEKTRDAMNVREKCAQLFCILGDAYSREELMSLVGDWGVGAVLFCSGK